MENSLDCNTINEHITHENLRDALSKRIVKFLRSFKIEGAEYLSRTK
jgi:hypothetical protein